MKPQILATALLATASLAHAGDIVADAIVPTPAASSEWDFLLAIYSPLMGIEGTVGVAGLSSEVDVPFDEILEQLDGGFMAAFEARRNRWSITGDFIWLKLSGDAQPTPNSYAGFKQEQIMASLALGYELYGNETTTLDLLGGAALTSLDAELELATPRLPVTARAGSGSDTWIDPFVGLRVRHRLSDRWAIFATGVYGGFGVSSDEYWQAIAGISYSLTENASIALAYRIISTDYSKGTFVYDVETSGPNLGLVFKF